MSNDETRRRIMDLIADMAVTTQALRKRGVEPIQREDREAMEIIKRIMEQAITAS